MQIKIYSCSTIWPNCSTLKKLCQIERHMVIFNDIKKLIKMAFWKTVKLIFYLVTSSKSDENHRNHFDSPSILPPLCSIPFIFHSKYFPSPRSLCPFAHSNRWKKESHNLSLSMTIHFCQSIKKIYHMELMIKSLVIPTKIHHWSNSIASCKCCLKLC